MKWNIDIQLKHVRARNDFRSHRPPQRKTLVPTFPKMSVNVSFVSLFLVNAFKTQRLSLHILYMVSLFFCTSMNVTDWLGQCQTHNEQLAHLADIFT